MPELTLIHFAVLLVTAVMSAAYAGDPTGDKTGTAADLTAMRRARVGRFSGSYRTSTASTPSRGVLGTS